MPLTAETLVEPLLLARLSRLVLHPRGLVEGSFAGLHKSPHRGASVEFAEYRKYVKGDDIRHIDWRVYARSDRFYLKEFEADTHLRCHLVLDASASMAFAAAHGRRFDYARRLVATLAYLVVQQGDHVGLQVAGDRLLHDIPPRGHPAHLRHLTETLLALEPAGRSDLPGVLHELAERIRRRALVIIVSDLLGDVPALLTCLQHLRHRKHDVALFHLLDPAELAFAFDRPIRFADLESPFHLTTEPLAVRTAYLHALSQYREQLRQGCGQFAVDYRLVTVDRELEEVLAAFLLARQGD
jgi:uncharacterized protein (DUF58 family)